LDQQQNKFGLKEFGMVVGFAGGVFGLFKLLLGIVDEIRKHGKPED